MANTDEPRGAWPANRVLSMRNYSHGTAAALYPGDFVIMNSAGKVVVATAGSAELLGVSVGYVPAATTTALIYDDPDQEYWVQDDGAAATLAATNIGNNFDIVATAGNATLLKSQHELDASDSSGTSAAQLRLLGYDPTDTIGKNVRCRVIINEHVHAKKTAGV